MVLWIATVCSCHVAFVVWYFARVRPRAARLLSRWIGATVVHDDHRGSWIVSEPERKGACVTASAVDLLLSLAVTCGPLVPSTMATVLLWFRVMGE
jgi:hypothetical protein